MDWKFQDPPNLAVIVNRKIINFGDWISYVSHDADDGGWQFHSIEEMSQNDAAVVSLISICNLDSSIAELFDLPLGWYAWRDSPFSSWKRKTCP
jgi:hypothetical protein